MPDAVTPISHRISLKNAVYARAAERAEIHSPRAATSLLKGGFIESVPLPKGVPDAATLRDSVTLLKNAVYVRAAERAEIHSPRAATSLR